MSASASEPSDETLIPAGESAAAERTESIVPELRGRLEVADRVVERVAGHAVTVVAGAAAAPRRVLGINLGEARPDDAASVSADVHDGFASVQATIAVSWPASVQAVADEVRRRIRTEVSLHTGVQVDHVDLEVVSMTVPMPAEPRVR